MHKRVISCYAHVTINATVYINFHQQYTQHTYCNVFMLLLTLSLILSVSFFCFHFLQTFNYSINKNLRFSFFFCKFFFRCVLLSLWGSLLEDVMLYGGGQLEIFIVFVLVGSFFSFFVLSILELIAELIL